MATCEKVNIECYLTEEERFQRKINGLEEKLDWTSLVQDGIVPNSMLLEVCEKYKVSPDKAYFQKIPFEFLIENYKSFNWGPDYPIWNNISKLEYFAKLFELDIINEGNLEDYIPRLFTLSWIGVKPISSEEFSNDSIMRLVTTIINNNNVFSALLSHNSHYWHGLEQFDITKWEDAPLYLTRDAAILIKAKLDKEFEDPTFTFSQGYRYIKALMQRQLLLAIVDKDFSFSALAQYYRAKVGEIRPEYKYKMDELMDDILINFYAVRSNAHYRLIPLKIFEYWITLPFGIKRFVHYYSDYRKAMPEKYQTMKWIFVLKNLRLVLKGIFQ